MNISNVTSDNQITFGKTPKHVQARARKVLSPQELKKIKVRSEEIMASWRVQDGYHNDRLESELLKKKISSKPHLILMYENLQRLRGNFFSFCPQEFYFKKKNPSSEVIENITGTLVATNKKEVSIVGSNFMYTLGEAYGNKYTRKERSKMAAELLDILGNSFKRRDRVRFAEQATACKNAATIMRKS